jgi:two-component system, sensor histidine kinase LadS
MFIQFEKVIYYFSTTCRFFVIIYVFFAINIDLCAQPIVELGTQKQLVLSSNEVFVFVDTSNSKTYNQIASDSFESHFIKVSEKDYYTKRLNVNYWLRFKLKSGIHQDWVVEFPDPHISSINFYRPNSTHGIDSLKMLGFAHSFSKKEFQHKNYVFKTFLPKDSVQTFYVLINTENYSGFTMSVRDTVHFTNYALTEYILLGFFYGVLLIMAIYNLFLYFSTRDKIYIFYVLYVLCCAFNSFSEDGLGFQYVWPNYPYVNKLVMLFTPLLLLSAFVVYSFSFLDIRRKTPILKTLIVGSYIFYVVVFFIERFVLDAQKLYQFVYLLPFILIYFTAFNIYLKGEKSARFFILAYTMIIISFIIFVFRILDMIPDGMGLFAVYSFNFGFLVEVVILSIALGDRFKIERAQRETFQKESIFRLKENESLKNELIVELKEKEIILDRVNKELETKVAVRTQDLQQKTDELSTFNTNLSKLVDDLNQMNIKLDVDNWQLKQKVQEEVKARLSDEELSTDKFKELFPDDASCLRYLENIKWSNGFKCKKCGHDRYIIHTSPFTRKCTSCKHVESVTAETLFHGIRIPLDKAFYIVYDTIRSGKSKTLEELSDILQLNKNTVWAFRKKIQASYEILKSKSKGTVVKWDDLLSN